MGVTETAAPRANWLERLAPLGALVFAIWLLIAFFTAPDTGETAQSVIDSAKANEGRNIFAQLLALAAPILIGWFVAALVHRMRAQDDAMPRVLTIVGGSLFVAFFTVAITVWTAPLIDSGDLTLTQAEAYLAFDDVGWVLLGCAGVAAGVMIIGVSLAAMSGGWTPRWLAWVSLVLGVASFATVAFFGLFAWIAWLIAAGALMLWRGNRAPVPTV